MRAALRPQGLGQGRLAQSMHQRRHLLPLWHHGPTILAAGYARVGFIHSGKPLSFVYDIADIIKFETVVPQAFEIAARGDANPDRAVRWPAATASTSSVPWKNSSRLSRRCSRPGASPRQTPLQMPSRQPSPNPPALRMPVTRVGDEHAGGGHRGCAAAPAGWLAVWLLGCVPVSMWERCRAGARDDLAAVRGWWSRAIS